MFEGWAFNNLLYLGHIKMNKSDVDIIIALLFAILGVQMKEEKLISCGFLITSIIWFISAIIDWAIK